MALTDSKVRSQLIPLAGMSLLLPNTCIAEVIAHKEPQPVDGAPEWLLGFIDWRGVRVPVISFEAVGGGERAQTDRRSRIVVLNGIGGDDDLPFFALVAQGIPRLMQLDATTISTAPQPESSHPMALQHTLVQEMVAIIPDQDKLEGMIKQQEVFLQSLPA